MASEYNSNLISKLYRLTNQKEVIEIIREMQEVKDPVFLRPILDGYERHKNSSIGHYFISALGSINSEDIEKALDDLLNKILAEERIGYLAWVLKTMNAHDYYPKEANEVAETYIKNYIDDQFRKDYRIDEIDLSYLLSYLKKSKLIDKHQDILRILLFDSNLEKNEKKIILSYLINIKSTEQIKYFIEIYPDKIKGKGIEIMIVNELTGWTGGNVRRLKDLILENGQSRAREIIGEEDEKEKKEEIKSKKTAQQKEAVIYENIEVVEEISGLRKQINTKSQSHPNFQFKLFLDSELLIQQTKIATDKSSLVSSCVDLRSLIVKINKEVKNHGLGESTIDKLLPDTQEADKEKSLNQFYLYCKAKEIKVDSDCFGLRPLNKIVNLLAHAEYEKELIKELTKVGILAMYKQQEWSKIHSYLLEQYKKALENVSKELD